MEEKINIISLTDVIEQKVRKEQQLAGYEHQLDDLKRKKFWLEKEIQMAEFIISAVRGDISPQAIIQGLLDNESKTDR